MQSKDIRKEQSLINVVILVTFSYTREKLSSSEKFDCCSQNTRDALGARVVSLWIGRY